MGQTQPLGVVRRLRLVQPWLWLTAVVAFGIGDVLTTAIGLSMAAVHEAGPLTSVFVAQHGLLAMVAVKVAVFGVFYGCWKVMPRRYRAGIPLGLALLGIVVVWWNIAVNLVALQL